MVRFIGVFNVLLLLGALAAGWRLADTWEFEPSKKEGRLAISVSEPFVRAGTYPPLGDFTIIGTLRVTAIPPTLEQLLARATVSISVRRQPLQKVIEDISKRSGLTMEIDPAIQRRLASRRGQIFITASYASAPVLEVLKDILGPHKLAAQVREGVVYITDRPLTPGELARIALARQASLRLIVVSSDSAHSRAHFLLRQTRARSTVVVGDLLFEDDGRILAIDAEGVRMVYRETEITVPPGTTIPVLRAMGERYRAKGPGPASVPPAVGDGAAPPAPVMVSRGRVAGRAREILGAAQLDSASDPANGRFIGLRVRRMPADHMAREYGLQEGDVILSINGTPVTNAVQLRLYLENHSQEARFVVRYRRRGRNHVAEIQMTD